MILTGYTIGPVFIDEKVEITFYSPCVMGDEFVFPHYAIAEGMETI
jgi:hypothetical protein